MTSGRQNISLKKDWGTPPKYVFAVKEVFGGKIDLDPCSNDYSVVNALTEYKLPQKNGLNESWCNYETIYVNPPYGKDKERNTTIKNWLEKCDSTHYNYNSEILSLIPVSVNTSHWKKYVFTSATSICFLYDTRLRFLNNGLDIGQGAPMACAMIYWGSNYKRFYEIFIHHGAVVDISNLIDESIGGVIIDKLSANVSG